MPQSKDRNEASPIPLWVSIVVVVGSLLLIAGGILALVRPAMLLSPQDQITSGVHVYAGYLFSRNLALGILLLVTLCLRARQPLNSLMVLYAFTQFLDAAIDCFEGRWPLVPGILALGAVFLFGSTRVGRPFWRTSS